MKNGMLKNQKPTYCLDTKKQQTQISQRTTLVWTRSLTKHENTTDGVENHCTCSSCFQHTRLFQTLKLNEGGNEAQGTSDTRICTHRNCTLKGKLLKVQHLSKLTGFRAFKPVGSLLDEKGTCTGQTSGFRSIPFLKEILINSIVEIFVKPQEPKVGSESDPQKEFTKEHASICQEELQHTEKFNPWSETEPETKKKLKSGKRR